MKQNKNATRMRPMADINVVPYIDVMLVLLVIFMITAPMLTQGVNVELPHVPSETIEAAQREPVIVSVDRDGAYFLNVSSTPNLPMEAHALMVRVAAELALAREAHESVHVLVKADRAVNYGKVVTAMGLLKQAGAEKVGLVTETPHLSEEG